MAFKVIVMSLLVACVSYTHGAAIPDQLMNQVQDFLVNPEPLAAAMGMRMKRSTGDWDKEFDMEALGLSFKLKYVDPAHPIKGGHVLMKFPAHRFVKSASFDDVELEFDFKGGEAVDGLFEMKFDYKFIQKFTFFADRPQQGTVTMYRKFENGMYKTNMRMDSNAKKLFDIYGESNYETHFVGKATFNHDNTWHVSVTRVPGKRVTIEFIQNGVEHSIILTFDKTALSANVKITTFGKTFNLDVQLNPAGKWGVQVTGNINGPLFERKFDLTFVPKSNYGFHVNYTLTHGAETYVSGDHDITVVNNDNKLEVKTLSKQTIDEDSMLYAIHCKLLYPLPCAKQIDVARKLFVDKKNKNVFFNKMTYDMKAKLDGKITKTIKIDTVKTPHVMIWNEPNDPHRHTFEVTVDHKPGQMLHIITNTPEMSSFKVTTNGVNRVLELNGEERVIVDYTKAERKFKQVLQLPNGEQIAISLDWATWNHTNNKMNVHFETSTRKFNVNMDYDITNTKAGRMMVRFRGENPLMGQFEFMRNGNWRLDANQLDAQWNGYTNLAKGPLAIFSPIDTTSTINYNFANNVLRGNLVKTINGQKWGLNF